MENERSSLITIGGEQYEMVLTTRATKAISTRYGGLDNLGDKLMKSENMEMALDEIVWLITLLCNQGIQIHNLKTGTRNHCSPRKPWNFSPLPANLRSTRTQLPKLC